MLRPAPLRRYVQASRLGALLLLLVLGLAACGGGKSGGETAADAGGGPPVAPAPAAPTAVQALIGDQQVTLSWSPVDAATSYALKRGAHSGGPYVQLAALTGKAFVDQGLTDGTPYYYVVTALNGRSESPASPEVQATPMAPILPPGGGPPPVPASLQASPGDQRVSLDWALVTGATSYCVKRAAVSGGPYLALATLSSGRYLDLGLSDGMAYYYVVTALNGTAESAASPEAMAIPLAAPGAPTALKAVQGDAQVSLSWAATPGAASYQVSRALASAGPFTQVGSATASPRFHDTGLSNGTPYFYVVNAENSTGLSPQSNLATAMPLATPSGLTAIGNSQQVGLFWPPAAGAASYKVYLTPQGGGSPTLLASVAAGRYLDGGLSNGTARSYQVSAVNALGEGAPSAPVTATPTAASTPLPPADDPTKNLAGLGTWFNCDWDGARAFADVMKQSRNWMVADWSKAAALDAQGWPTEDASTVLMTDSPAFVNGTYQLSFQGQAKISGLWITCTVANQVFDATTNTTTAAVTFRTTLTNSMGLVFTNTRRTPDSPLGSGFTQARLYRPGYATDGSAVFTTDFLQAFTASGAQVVRMMDWDGGSSVFIQHWADRTTPLSATQAGLPGPPYTAPDGVVHAWSAGVALEHRIQLCNTLHTDFWLNIPPVADQDYITRTALMLKFGSDGQEPYTSPQAHPVYPPLDPQLKVYVEYGNETWNSAGGYPFWGVEMAACEHLPAGHPLRIPATDSIYTLMWRWPAYNIANISETFRGVFGDAAMMTRVRPVLEAQEGDGQDTLGTALTWLEAYAPTLPTPRKVADLLYGGGGSAYYGVINSQNADPSVYLAAANYPDPQTLEAWAADSMWTLNAGIQHVAYEGGPSPAFTDAENQAIQASALMIPYMEAMHDAWTSVGGDLATYYCLRGPSSWEFTPDITVSSSPKLEALHQIASRPRAALTLGTPMPGVIQAVTSLPALAYNGYTYGNTVAGQAGVHTESVGYTMAFPVRCASAMTGSLTLSGTSDAANGIQVYVNGALQPGTLALPPDTTSSPALETSNALPIQLPAGLAMIRLVMTRGTITLCSLQVQ